MASSNSYQVVHFMDGDKHDFNLLMLPDTILVALSNALKWEHQKRMQAAAAPSFKQERLIQNERYVKECNARGEVPKQLFLDLKND